MAKALYCPFPTCKNEYYTLCPMHQAIMPSVRAVIEHHDPEHILSDSVNISNLQPMIKMLEEQWRENQQLLRRLHSTENELHRILGGV